METYSAASGSDPKAIGCCLTGPALSGPHCGTGTKAFCPARSGYEDILGNSFRFATPPRRLRCRVAQVVSRSVFMISDALSAMRPVMYCERGLFWRSLVQQRLIRRGGETAGRRDCTKTLCFHRSVCLDHFRRTVVRKPRVFKHEMICDVRESCVFSCQV